jgi:hypothetical protein
MSASSRSTWLGLGLLVAGASPAAALSTSGAVVQIAPPASVLLGALESTSEIRLFAEAQGVVLSGALTVDVRAPGFYDETTDLTPGTIAAGTRVWSWLLHFDTAGNTSAHLSGAITFDRKILGLIFLDGSLDASDAAVGLGTTAYPAGFTARGTELGPSAAGDKLEILAGRRTLDVNRLNVALGIDQVRVVLAEPAGLLAAALALAVARLARR